ncbi:MAG: DUF2924 domain-containing protein [Alphaproteobacteria bacterium]|nr:DUF2924 domain-containing protein [Alphaproteobacteria bacterium]
MVQIDLATLESLTRPELVTVWASLNEAPPPRKLSRQLMARLIAYDVQIARDRGLSAKARRALASVAAGKTGAARPRPRPGARLIREWNGVTHVVEACESGYVYRDRTWRSLSAIARAITGAHWSGPRFFRCG